MQTQDLPSDLSERLTELFVLTAGLYFAQRGNDTMSPAARKQILHDTARDLAGANPSLDTGEIAGFKLLADGLHDAAELADNAELETIALMLRDRATKLLEHCTAIDTNPWDRTT